MFRMALSMGHPISRGSAAAGLKRYTLRLPQKITPTGVATMLLSPGQPISADTCVKLAPGSSLERSPCHSHVDTSVKIASGADGCMLPEDCGTTASPDTLSPKSRVSAVAGKKTPWSRLVCSSPGIKTEVDHTRRFSDPVPPAP